MSEWISINNEWPDAGDLVILGGGDVISEQGYQLDGKEFYLSRTDSYDDPIRVFPTHWQPLPEPPEAK